MRAADLARAARAAMSRPRRLLLAVMLLAIGLPLPITLLGKFGPEFLHRPLSSPALFGFTAPAEPLSFSADAWRDGELQRGLDHWFAGNLEPRGWTVRLVNQLYYSLFRRSYMLDDKIVAGREDYLYSINYLEAYCRPAPAERDLAPLVARIAALHDRLARDGHPLLLMITPSKAVTMPEFLPAWLCDPPQPPERAGQLFGALLRAAGLPVVDGAAATRTMKGRDPLPPFPRGGTHWSKLVGARVAAAVMAEIGRQAGVDLGGLSATATDWDAPPTGTDADLALVLNLLVPPLDYPTARPELQCRPTSAGMDTALIALGGSFLEEVEDPIAKCRLFGRVERFAYYTKFRARYPAARPEPVDRATLDWRAILEPKAVVLLEVNESTIDAKIPWLDEFLDDALAALK
jgi:SGNH hydrolase-like domain, acetyltransferase AlgX